MNISGAPDHTLEKRLSACMLDVLIRAGLLLALVMICYKIFSPFLPLMLWAMILSVTLYPLHQQIAKRIGGKQGAAATLIVLAGLVAIVAPTTVLVSLLGDSLHGLINDVKNNSLHIPTPPHKVADFPFIGTKLYGFWSQACSDLPALIQNLQPKLGKLTKQVLDIVASLGGSTLQFMLSFIIAGILMSFGESGAKVTQSIFERIVGIDKGKGFADLSTATVRTVATGVVGIACIQALIIGLVMFAIGIPLAGILSLIILVLGVAQLPAALVTLPVIGFIWLSGDYSTATAITDTVLLFVASMVDNILKPFILGRGVDVPMPVILFGALGGMATKGILGLFLGATFFALGYQIFMWWVANNLDIQQGSDA